MKKLSLILSSLLVFSCSNQVDLSLLNNDTLSVNNIEKSKKITAKIGYSIALKEVKKFLSKPQLFEIDVWNENNSNSIHFGFMQKNINDYDYIRIIIDTETGNISNENITPFKTPKPVDLANWKLDQDKIYEIAQNNGLKDDTFLATLWEDTWHISGLKQNLYFQINSNNGQIKLICIGPYMNDCTDGDNNPITNKNSLDFQKQYNSLRK